ncbi:MAG: cupin domain-containing protein [Fimbriimonadaceae bacterium]
MIRRFSDRGWDGVSLTTYKDEPGTWVGVTRRLLSGDTAGSQRSFEVRYFEIAPGGYTTHEKHAHEHCVIVLRGTGRVLLDGTWHEIGPFDVVNVGPWVPHQFANDSDEPFGLVCIVDRERDRPVPLGIPDAPRSSKD